MEIGGLTYTVDARIDGLLKFDKRIEATTANAVDGFNKIDKAADKATTSIQKGMESAGTAATNAGNKIDKTADAVDNAGNSMRGVSSVAGNLGFQLQDIAVQAQAGTSAFVILGQQGSQIASAFGPGGAVLGAVIAVASALGGVLFTSLQDSGTASERLEAAMKALAETASQTEGGFAILSDEIERLARVSKAAAESQIRAALVQSQQAIKESSKAMSELIEQFSSAPDFIFDIQDALDTMNRTGATSSVLALAKGIGKDFGFAGQAATDAGFEILTSINAIAQAKDPQVISDMRDRLLAIAEGSKLSKDQIAQLVTGINNFAGQAVSAAESMTMLTGAQKDLGKALVDSTKSGIEARSSIEELVKAVENQAAVIGLTERGIALYTAEQIGASAADKQRINDIYDVIEAKKGLITEIEREMQAELDLLDAKTKAEQKAKIDAERARDALGSRVQDIGLTPEQQTAARLQRESDLLRQAKDQDLLTEQQYQERLATLRQQYEDKQGGGLFSTLSESLSGLQNQVSGTFAQMALGFEDSDKLAQRLGQTILTELIGATINWGIQQAIAYAQGVAGEGAKASAAVAANTAAAASASTGIAAVTGVAVASGAAIAAAMAPAAALTSLATAGANSAPATAGIIATSAAAQGVALSGVGLGALGGRLYGGPVQPGGIYPITEDGRPEILQQGNRQYLLPGAGGKVISNRDMMQGGSGGMTVYVTNTTNLSAIDTTNAQQFIAQNAEAVAAAVDKVANKYGRGNRR